MRTGVRTLRSTDIHLRRRGELDMDLCTFGSEGEFEKCFWPAPLLLPAVPLSAAACAVYHCYRGPVFRNLHLPSWTPRRSQLKPLNGHQTHRTLLAGSPQSLHKHTSLLLLKLSGNSEQIHKVIQSLCVIAACLAEQIRQWGRADRLNFLVRGGRNCPLHMQTLFR